MENPTNNNGIKEFDVTGVSRSGRVRKKSSKLLDFQSPDEVEKKPKKIARAGTVRGTRGRPPLSETAWKRKSGEGTLSTLDDSVMTDIHESSVLGNNQSGGDGICDVSLTTRMNTDDDDGGDDIDGNADDDDEAEEDDDELDELVADIVEGVEAEADLNDTKVKQSLYMTEKSNKKKILKDGRIVTGKTQRKDKGKTRFTAYSLWAREFRKTKLGPNQDLDFANTARRLSELWANVPNNEKNIWRRKAKRLACKSNQLEAAELPTPITEAEANSLFLNRATTSRTKKLAADKVKSPSEVRPKTVATLNVKRGSKQLHEKHSSIITNNTSSSTTSTSLQTSLKRPISNYGSGSTGSSHKQSLNKQVSVPLSGIQPIDAAAHLKLLGESLSIIGERLKEHEGQITVSGSLSVLLDSLLCSVGPLMCLTTRLPGLEKRKDLSDNLTATLDNIAYVMPGL